MSKTIRIGIIGDFNASFRSHITTNEAIQHASDHLSIITEICWLPTQYKSLEGALNAIRFKEVLRCH